MFKYAANDPPWLVWCCPLRTLFEEPETTTDRASSFLMPELSLRAYQLRHRRFDDGSRVVVATALAFVFSALQSLFIAAALTYFFFFFNADFVLARPYTRSACAGGDVNGTEFRVFPRTGETKEKKNFFKSRRLNWRGRRRLEVP